MLFFGSTSRNKARTAVRVEYRNLPTDPPNGGNASFRKRGPGRFRPPSPFSEKRERFLEAFRENPINRLSGRELARLSALAKRLDFKTVDQLVKAAEELIAQRAPIFAGE